MSHRELRIGTRGSDLALWQAHRVQTLLTERFPGRQFPIEIIRTQGDRVTDTALYRLEDKGFFTREIEHALLEGRVDVAVHSLKDLPTTSPEGLTVGAVPEREDARDVWIALDGKGPEEIAPGARVGTSSLRRQAQLRAFRRDLVLEDLRGNVPTRLRKLRDGEYDAIILARAGLHRLGLLPDDAVTLPLEWMLPAPGQGALGVQVRSDDVEALERVATLESFNARVTVAAERALLSRLQGGCLVPVGALAERIGRRIELRGMVADLSGDPIFRGVLALDAEREEEARALGIALAEELLARGAGAVLERVREFLRQAASSSKSATGSPPESATSAGN